MHHLNVQVKINVTKCSHCTTSDKSMYELLASNIFRYTEFSLKRKLIKGLKIICPYILVWGIPVIANINSSMSSSSKTISSFNQFTIYKHNFFSIYFNNRRIKSYPKQKLRLSWTLSHILPQLNFFLYLSHSFGQSRIDEIE